MLFKEVIGHETEKGELMEMIHNDRLPHALIFHGPPGNGKLATAVALARYLLCQNQQEQDACGVCASCLKVNKLVHPDLHFSYPTTAEAKIASQVLPKWRPALLDNPYLPVSEWLTLQGATSNQQGNIYTAECLDIVKKISLRAFSGGYKILIMWLPEFLGNEGNRLLKLIEEPPANTVFILVAEQMELLLTTIISRCQLIRFGNLKDEVIAAALTENGLAPKPQSSKIALLADGNYHLAKHIAATNVEDARDAQFIEWMRICYSNRKRVDWVKQADQFAKLNRDEQKFFFQYGLLFLRELLTVKYGHPGSSRLNDNEQKSAAGMAKLLSLDAIQTLEQEFSAAIYHIQRSANARLLLIGLAIRVNRLFSSNSNAVHS